MQTSTSQTPDEQDTPAGRNVTIATAWKTLYSSGLEGGAGARMRLDEVDKGPERGRNLPPARVVQIKPDGARRPILQQRHQSLFVAAVSMAAVSSANRS